MTAKSKTETAFRCDECGATFRDADALAKHRRVHESSAESELEQGTQEPMQQPSLPPTGIDVPIRST